MSEDRTSGFWSGCEYTATDRRNLRRFNLWALAWIVTWVTSTLLMSRGKIAAGPLAYSLVAVTILLGMLTMRSYVHFLRQADELLGKIQLEALALGFGAGAVFMLAYRLCELLGAPPLDSSGPVMVMMVVWAVSQILVARRYR